ncbi:helix-turn-helix domain-containing protein [Streptomyces sp. NBC_01003]|uniref:hypothetical protein n=1 Tax=Streptomyces sp. NBC_01003 TaxID=2903714 RepID=UPI0038643B5A|nr:helix-turn-helix domain-containing protein [Streptomyces sp. NBC_01003]
MHNALGHSIVPMPNQENRAAAQAAFGAESRTLTDLTDLGKLPDRISVPLPVLPLARHLLTHAGQEVYATGLHTAIGIPINTLYKQLRRLETAGWLRSRREATDERPCRGGRGRTYYTLTTLARLIPVHVLPPEI